MEQNNTTAIALGQSPQVGAKEDFNIDMGKLVSEWNTSKDWVKQYSRDFQSLDNLTDGVPLNADPDNPYIGDTTLPGLVRSIPRDSLQQIPVFAATVNGTKNSIQALICTYLLKKFVFNEDTFGKGLLSTLQIGAEQALTHGYAPFVASVGTKYSDFGTTLRLLHYTDTAPEVGIQDHNETGYDYVKVSMTESRVRRILRSAKNNPDTTWDVEGLQGVLDMGPKQEDYARYQSAPRQNQTGEAGSQIYEFVTRYEVAPGGTVITFCPDYTGSGKPLRVYTNKSKWGYPRVNYLVIDPDGLSPFGASRVRLASPNVNLLNIYYGQIAAMLLLNSKPPILKKGRFTGPVQLKRGVTWSTPDVQASAELKNMDNGSLQQFPTITSQLATQIQNIMGGQTQSAPAVDKFSKVGPGVKQAQAFLDVNTNQVTKILENFLRQHALVALDTAISEQDNTEDELIVDDDTKNAINQLEPGTIAADNNKIKMNWPRFYAAIEEWSVEIMVSLSKDELDDKKRGDLQDTLTVLAQNASELGPDAVERVKELTNMMLQDKVPLVKPLSLAAPIMPTQPTVDPNQPVVQPGQ